MAHDVYVCYDERDLETAKNVCDTLESNGLDCWMKNRDAISDNVVDEIMAAIKKTKVIVLLFSENSKHSRFVNNEVDEAFSKKRSILVYQIDDSKMDDNLGFFLKNKPKIEAYPNPEDKFDKLVENTSELVKKQKAKDRNILNLIKNNKVPVIIGVVVLLLVVGVLGYMMTGDGNGDTNATQLKAGDVKLKITDFHVDDVSKKKTDWNYAYFVGGSISPTPSEKDGCMIVVDFYDQNGTLVDSKETPFDEAQQVSSGFLFGTATADKNTIKLADVQLINKDNVILAQDDSEI